MKLKYDLHIHSALSPCGDIEMTPNNIVNMAKLMGIDVIALTDHNTCKNCGAVMKVGEKQGLTVIPGMELCTSEEVHIICLFKSLKSALDFSDFVYDNMPHIKNKPEIFGRQIIMNENDEEIAEVEKLLITASSISCNSVHALVEGFGGVSFPAHIDRSSFSIISNLGTIDSSFGFTCAEIYDLKKAEELKNKFPYLNKMKIVSSSDAHYLESFRPPSENLFIEATENSVEAILEYFK